MSDADILDRIRACGYLEVLPYHASPPLVTWCCMAEPEVWPIAAGGLVAENNPTAFGGRLQSLGIDRVPASHISASSAAKEMGSTFA
jgi:hypothetical protein